MSKETTRWAAAGTAALGARSRPRAPVSWGMNRNNPASAPPGPPRADRARAAASDHRPPRLVPPALSVLLTLLLTLVAAAPASAQTAIVTDGVIESTGGGFRFPDGTVQTTAGGSGLSCASGDFVYCYAGPPETLDVGECRPGTRTCEASGTAFGPCTGEVAPAAEVCDGRDNDCDGTIDEGGICDGELVITEILYDSSGVPDESFEWFEVHNPNAHPVNMLGWAIRDAEGSGQEVVVVQSELIVAAGGYAVLCHNADPSFNGGVVCDYEYGAFTLANTADEVILEAGGVVVDAVAWDEGAGWPAATSGSLNLDPAALTTAANDSAASWCNSPDGGPEIANGDEGTPGAANVSCS